MYIDKTTYINGITLILDLQWRKIPIAAFSATTTELYSYLYMYKLALIHQIHACQCLQPMTERDKFDLIVNHMHMPHDVMHPATADLLHDLGAKLCEVQAPVYKPQQIWHSNHPSYTT